VVLVQRQHHPQVGLAEAALEAHLQQVRQQEFQQQQQVPEQVFHKDSEEN